MFEDQNTIDPEWQSVLSAGIKWEDAKDLARKRRAASLTNGVPSGNWAVDHGPDNAGWTLLPRADHDRRGIGLGDR